MLVFLGVWLLIGICGYFMMYLCDTATGEKLCKNNFYVFDDSDRHFILALILAPLAFLVGLAALNDWKEYTQNLKKKLQA